MKRKMLLPLLAVVFAIAGAFASSPLAQQTAWFKPLGGSVAESAITVPDNTDEHPCTTSGTNLCKVGVNQAYDTSPNADAQGSIGQLMYD